jgi:RimJ/RimL family protein N-acetyltransferase
MSIEQRPTLTDGVVTLRSWRSEDALWVYAACQDPLLARFVPVPQPYSREDAEWFVERRAQDWQTDDERSFAIVDAGTDAGLGAIARHGPFGHRFQFGYWLAPEARGRGTATRALRLIVDWTLATTDAIRLELYTDIANDASGRVAERAGFEHEGVRRAWDIDRHGRPMDAVFYVRIRDPGRDA